MARRAQAAEGLAVETTAGPAAPCMTASGRIRIATAGEGFVELTAAAAGWLAQIGARDGLLTLFVRHTSASLAIQENADPDVRRDLLTALRRLAPEDGPWRHTLEGPDDMPAHVRSMLTAVSLQIPVAGGRLALGTWQGVFLIEHRRAPHAREVALVYLGA